MPPQNLTHTGVHRRRMLLDVCIPVALLVEHILVAHADAAKQLDYAGVEVFLQVALKRVVGVRVKLRRVLLEAGKVNGRSAVNDGVVVVGDKAGVSHVLLRGVASLGSCRTQKDGCCPPFSV